MSVVTNFCNKAFPFVYPFIQTALTLGSVSLINHIEANKTQRLESRFRLVTLASFIFQAINDTVVLKRNFIPSIKPFSFKQLVVSSSMWTCAFLCLDISARLFEHWGKEGSQKKSIQNKIDKIAAGFTSICFAKVAYVALTSIGSAKAKFAIGFSLVGLTMVQLFGLNESGGDESIALPLTLAGANFMVTGVLVKKLISNPPNTFSFNYASSFQFTLGVVAATTAFFAAGKIFEETEPKRV